MLLDPRRALALLGIAAVIGALTVPAVCAVLYLQSDAEPRPRPQTHPAGTSVDVRTTNGSDVWGRPADVDLAAVTCTGNDPSGTRARELAVGAPESGPSVVTVDGTRFRYLTTAGDDLSTTAVACRGGGLEEVVLSDHVDRGEYRRLALTLPIAVPVLLLVAYGVRRSGVRLSGRHREPAASWRVT